MDYRTRVDCRVLLLIMLLFYKPVNPSKILVAASSGVSSHLMFNLELVKTLLARGHEVWIIVDEETYEFKVRSYGLPPEIRFVFFKNQITLRDGDILVKRYVSRQLRSAMANSALQYRFEAEERELRTRIGGSRKLDIFNLSGYVIDNMLSNTEAMAKLKSVGFDMVVGDSVTLYQVFLSQVLKVPYIQFGLSPIAPSQHDRFADNPSNPAYVPERMSFLSDNMTFRERVKNTLLYWTTGFFYYKYFLGPMDEVLRKHNIRPDANIGQLLKEADMWIFNSDFVVDFPRPLNPHVKFVGGLLTSPAKPLDAEWQAFVDSSRDDGIVILALGTLINDEMTDEQTENIATSLSMLSQKVAWGYNGKLPKTLGNNTKISKWLPQNDLLGNSKTRAFISHGGLNSIHQCIYHAVPIVGIPVFGDQKDNFVRLEAKGIAIHLDIRSLTERSIYDATVEVIYNRKYKEIALRLSEISRDRLMSIAPINESAYWIEYAIKHGTEHLKPYSLQLSIVQYYLLDVIGFNVLMVGVFCWCVKRMCCPRRRSG